MTNNNIMGVRKVINYPDLRIAIICLSRVSCSFLGRHFCYSSSYLGSILVD